MHSLHNTDYQHWIQDLGLWIEHLGYFSCWLRLVLLRFLKVSLVDQLSWLEDLPSRWFDGARPQSSPAGGYEPPCRPRYTVKRSMHGWSDKRQTFPFLLKNTAKFGIIVFEPFFGMYKEISHKDLCLPIQDICI